MTWFDKALLTRFDKALLTWFDKALLTRFEKVGHTTEEWAEKKVTTTRQSRQSTERSVE